MSATPQPLRCVVSISGIRGIIGSDLDIIQLSHLAAAFAESVAGPGPIVVGRDSRGSGALIVQAVSAALRAVGRQVIDLGIVPTPTVPLTLAACNGGGGIQVSASHNPGEWNALKLFSANGRNIDQSQLDRLLVAYGQPKAWRPSRECGGYREDPQAIDRHIEQVIEAVDAPRIAKAGLTVVLDSVNGAGSVIGPRLLERLGCRVVPLYCRPAIRNRPPPMSDTSARW